MSLCACYGLFLRFVGTQVGYYSASMGFIFSQFPVGPEPPRPHLRALGQDDADDYEALVVYLPSLAILWGNTSFCFACRMRRILAWKPLVFHIRFYCGSWDGNSWRFTYVSTARIPAYV